MATRLCRVCDKEKPVVEFPEATPGHRRTVCRPCFNARRTNKGLKDSVSNARVSYKDTVQREKLTVIEEHRLKTENRDLRARNAELIRQLAEGSEYNEVVRAAMAAPIREPKIAPRERTSRLREGTPLVLASDWHVEERVLPERVAHRNRYNKAIATQRMQRFFEAFRWAVKQQRDTYKIRDAVLWLGGDFITNFLHEDDVENNEMPPLEALLFWQTELVKGLLFLLEDEEIEQFVIPMNDGNHSRLTKKMRAATRTDHSLEVFAYAQLKLRFANEPRLKFVMPTSQFTYLDNIYGKTIRFTHGDTFKYGGGVGGLTVPLIRALARWESVKRAELTCIGHWHQRMNMPTWMVNGSLIGYNAFAMSIGCPFESPVQSLRMLDSRRWLGTDIPLYVSDRSDDVATRG